MSTEFEEILKMVAEPDTVLCLLCILFVIVGMFLSAIFGFFLYIGNCFRYLAKYIKRKYELSK